MPSPQSSSPGRGGKKICSSRIFPRLQGEEAAKRQVRVVTFKSLGTRFVNVNVAVLLLGSVNAHGGDAVAVGFNSDGIWTDVTYYCSSTPKGGKDYKTEKEAQELALRDVRKRSEHETATATILASSDAAGFAAVARGKAKSGKDVNVVGYGTSRREAEM